MNKENKWLIVFLMVFAVVSTIAISSAVISKNRSFDSRTEAVDELERQQFELTGIPRVASVDPSVAYLGEDFNYYLSIIDSDTPLDDIEVVLVSAPSWMYLDSMNFRLYGKPQFDGSDTTKVELKIDDGTNVVHHKFYMLIMESDE